MLAAVPYKLPMGAATAVAQLCCSDNQLPQGAPSSPVVSNMLCGQLDSQLRRLAERLRCVYTRYADDLTFSTSLRDFPTALVRLENDPAASAGNIAVVGIDLRRIIEGNGFRVNSTKVRLQRTERRQVVTGITVNRKPNLSRRYVRQIRAMLHAWQKYGLAAAASEFRVRYDDRHRAPRSPVPDLRAVIRGKLEFLAMVKRRTDPVYVNLLNRARRLDPSFYEQPFYQDAVWAIDDGGSGSQGTAFGLEGYGIISCEHVLGLTPRLYRSERPTVILPVTATLIDKNHDVAIMQAATPLAVQLQKGNPNTLRIGDHVTLLGHPRQFDGQTVQVSQGQITGFRPLHGARRFSITAAIIKGNSGGPVLNNKYEVVGIAVTGADQDPPDFENGVIPIDVLDALLETRRASPI